MPASPLELLDELIDVRERDVLDVGCGEGGLARRLASKGARVVGVDPLASALEIARAEDSPDAPVSYLEGGAQELPFDDDSFDVVILFNSLHHVPGDSLDAALSEAARVLRAAGTVYVQEPLAQGSFYELLLLVEDETGVREEALAALERSLETAFVERARREAKMTMRLADFDALRQRMVSVDPERGATFDEHDAVLRERFQALGRETDDGYEFDIPVRVFVFGPRP
jgi:ubiquinone/menaquinone biosynthesis C-methylase UbiE